MVSVIDLEKATLDFFIKFCRKETFGEFPKWSHRWEFIGSLPNNEYKGCYAHLSGEDVVYIGLGISNTSKGSGIGARVNNYWISTGEVINGDKKYKSNTPDITSIITLPFDKDTFYLAAALEVYLIQNLDVTKNRMHSKIK